MDIVVTTDLAHVARELGLPVDQVQRTVELLDEGNTVPFITRFRKDQTGGFDEEQIRTIQTAVGKARMLAERKQTILKSIQSQGKLDPDLTGRITGSQSTKRLEDLYLPYKPKKQTLATTARQRGLQPLADEVLAASPLAADLDLRAGDYMNPDVGLYTRADVLLGVGHLLAESFSERADLRSKLRKILRVTGRLVSSRLPPPEESAPVAKPRSEPAGKETPAPSTDAPSAPAQEQAAAPMAGGDAAVPGQVDDQAVPEGSVPTEPARSDGPTAPDATETPSSETPPPPAAAAEQAPPSDAESAQESPDATKRASQPADEAVPAIAEAPSEGAEKAAGAATESPPSELEVASESQDAAGTLAGAEQQPPAEPQPTVESQPSMEPQGSAAASADEPGSAEQAPSNDERPAGASPPAGETMPAVAKSTAAPPTGARTERARKEKKKKKGKKEKEREKKEKAFKDYFKFQEDLTRLLPHRILAINRGERAKILRVRVECDTEQMMREAEALLITPDHPHGEFLRGVIRDTLTRLLIPSLEREVRRELTDKAEAHAVEVFARNLRHLLLTPPLHGRRVLAIDPGFRSGCKMAALDECGNVLGHGAIHLVGSEERRQKARYRVAEIIRMHRLSVVAIGNGSACRDVEQLVADVIAGELKDLDVAFCIVNEAGASVYSTSGLGREEMPDYDATLRSAVSIGRRLLDPLSELVKINPSNIGVGLYQHDVKAKHLRESLDAVVESCVNYVGVDVNTASPALLRYVSGLNQLTARRLHDYRLQHGPFKNLGELEKVPGLGAATFVQAAGFLKIRGGDNPLDATWIHPESYDVARRVLEKLDSSVSDLPVEVAPPAVPPSAPQPVETPTEQTPPAAEPHPTGPAADDAASETAVVPTAQGTESEPTPGVEAAAEPAPMASAETAETEPATTVETTGTQTATAAEQPEPGAAAERPETEAAPEPSSGQEDAATVPPADQPGEQAGAGEPTVETPEDRTDLAAGPAAEEAPPAAEPASAPTKPAASHVDLANRVAEVDVDQMVQELGIGKLLLKDMLAALARPTRDPREDLSHPIFRRGIVKIDDLEAGMELAGTVLNVVDFGVFVDIGLNDSALIHVSRLADRYVRDPHEVVSVGDVIKVWVVETDKKRRRVSLTAIKPGTERSPAERRGKRGKDRGKEERPPRERAAAKHAAQGSRPAQGGGRKRQFRTQPPRKPVYKPKPKPKPVVPITDGMKKGNEPMRTFSDLQQFWKLQEQEPPEQQQQPPKTVDQPPETVDQPPDPTPDSQRDSSPESADE